MEIQTDFITVREVAAFLRKSERTIRMWKQEGLLPSYRIGGSVLFRLGEIEAALAQRNRVAALR